MFNIYQWCQNHKVNRSFITPKGITVFDFHLSISLSLLQNDCQCHKNIWYILWVNNLRTSKEVSERASEQTRNAQPLGRLKIALQKSNMKLQWQTCYKCGIHVRLRDIDNASRIYPFASEPEMYRHSVIVLAWIHLPLFALWIVHMVKMIQQKWKQ